MQTVLPSNGPIPGGPRDPRLSDRTRLALRMLPSELGLPLPWRRRRGGRVHCAARRLCLIIPLLALMWFARLYLHYCSQWLFLQAMAVPVNKFEFHAHTVDLVYQNSLLHTREELALVVAGPLTLNAVTFLLVLIRRGCQQIFGSLPSFTSDFIMAQGVWTVLDPGAVLAVDAVLGRLAYSPDRPVGDAAKLYWHFLRNSQSGAAGVVITLFLYAVLLLLSVTILFIYLLRFHNDGRMLDTFQRLSAREGDYFLPRDLELSNQELSHIVKKAEQWRGFNGERRKRGTAQSTRINGNPAHASTPGLGHCLKTISKHGRVPVCINEGPHEMSKVRWVGASCLSLPRQNHCGSAMMTWGNDNVLARLPATPCKKI
ncbi:unnamed protein product [Boreogadus saida]